MIPINFYYRDYSSAFFHIVKSVLEVPISLLIFLLLPYDYSMISTRLLKILK